MEVPQTQGSGAGCRVQVMTHEEMWQWASGPLTQFGLEEGATSRGRCSHSYPPQVCCVWSIANEIYRGVWK
jgi:hypothetical protein